MQILTVHRLSFDSVVHSAPPMRHCHHVHEYARMAIESNTLHIINSRVTANLLCNSVFKSRHHTQISERSSMQQPTSNVNNSGARYDIVDNSAASSMHRRDIRVSLID